MTDDQKKSWDEDRETVTGLATTLTVLAGVVLAFVGALDEPATLTKYLLAGSIVSAIVCLRVWTKAKSVTSPIEGADPRQIFHYEKAWRVMALVVALGFITALVAFVSLAKEQEFISHKTFHNPKENGVGIAGMRNRAWLVGAQSDERILLVGEEACYRFSIAKNPRIDYIAIVGVGITVLQFEALPEAYEMLMDSTWLSPSIAMTVQLRKDLKRYDAEILEAKRELTIQTKDSLPIPISIYLDAQDEGIYTIIGDALVEYKGKIKTYEIERMKVAKVQNRFLGARKKKDMPKGEAIPDPKKGKV